jgi:hypothetical protein
LSRKARVERLVGLLDLVQQSELASPLEMPVERREVKLGSASVISLAT